MHEERLGRDIPRCVGCRAVLATPVPRIPLRGMSTSELARERSLKG